MKTQPPPPPGLREHPNPTPGGWRGRKKKILFSTPTKEKKFEFTDFSHFPTNLFLRAVFPGGEVSRKSLVIFPPPLSE